MKRFIVFLTSTLLLACLTLFLIKNFWIENLIHFGLQRAGLHHRSYSIGAVKLKYSPLTLTLKRFRLERGLKGNAYWTFDADKIEIILKKSSLLSKSFRAKSIEIDNLNVVLSEVIPIIKQKKSGIFNIKNSDIEIDKLKVINSKFTYIDSDRKNKRALGMLNFDGIEVYANNLSTESLTKTKQKFFAQGSMQGSKIKLDIETNFNSNPNVRIDLDIENQSLKAFNEYLEPVEGYSIDGDIIKSVAHTTIKDKVLDSTTKIRFKDLKVKVLNNEKRNAFESFIGQWLIKNLTCSKRLGVERPIESVRVKMQKKDKAWVPFIISGLLKSAMRQACL
jgi:hypothetical protein